jgi:hypothetical protein
VKIIGKHNEQVSDEAVLRGGGGGLEFRPGHRLYFVLFQARLQNCGKRLLSASCPSVRPHGTTVLQLDGFQ